ncbi:MAG: hypothetical protein J6T01_05090 [Kiritimatiellae bacterium]|nr:hypothetical protein [Kiritimatiellia bacterium]
MDGNIVFPNADSSGDLSSKTAWGNTAMPSANTDYARITSAAGESVTPGSIEALASAAAKGEK